MAQVTLFEQAFDDGVNISGEFHEPAGSGDDRAIVLTHGAGGDRNGLLLLALAEVFSEKGVAALRCDLPYRQRKPKGPPSPSGAAKDRLGLRRAADALRAKGFSNIYLAGSSYGGRQASMLAAEQSDAAGALLLLSYPLHPPGKPERLRTEHFSEIMIPVYFAHGSKDAFGTPEELSSAARALGGPTRLSIVQGASHGLLQKRDGPKKVLGLTRRIAQEFLSLLSPGIP